ncbi:hypothetical protein D3C73_1151550 [compost metagenome]
MLDRYDYIIGDWGYSQLRLKGFYRDNHPKVNRDTAISGMVDYINEYCNFGCAYFVLHKLKELPKDGDYKDILIKDSSEQALDEAASQEQAETAAVTVREHREAPSRAAERNKDGGSSKEHGGKERQVREHQSRNHRNKDGQGKKHHRDKEGQGRQQNHNQRQPQNKADNQPQQPSS